MKPFRLAALLVVLAVLAMAVVSTPSFAAPAPTPTCPPNLLLTNSGFEEGTAGWSNYGGTLSSVDSPVHGGDYAAKLACTPPAAWIYQVVSIQGGWTYTFCGYAIKNDADIEAVYLRIRWYEEQYGRDEISSVASQHLTSNDPNYLRLTVTDTAPPNAHWARVGCVLELYPTARGPATAYFDDMSFEGPPPMPSPTPTPTPSPASTPAPTPSPTPTPTSTPTPTPSPTSNPTPTPSPTPTATPTPSPTSMSSPTATSTAGTPAKGGDVLINEVQYNPSQSGSDEHHFEWVELFNPTANAIELEGWTIRDNHESDPIPSLTLSPNGFAVIAATEDFSTNFPGFDGNLVFLDDGNIVFIEDGRIGNGLSNDGDRLILKDSAGNIVDSLSYGDDDTIISPPYPKVAEGHSLERSPPGGEFVDNPNPTPGSGLSATPTPVITPASTTTPTATPTSPPPGTATPPPDETTASLGMALRAALIVIAIAFLGIVLWLRSRRSRK